MVGAVQTIKLNNAHNLQENKQNKKITTPLFQK
jgi:hypothetical protein